MRPTFAFFSLTEFHTPVRCAARAACVALAIAAVYFPAIVNAETLEKAMEAYDFQEYQDAANWLRPWAEKGKVEAQYRLGMLYENGNGVDKSINEARKWYEKAASQGHEHARRRLDAIEGKTAKPGNESVALKWYQDLADQGDPDAQYNLGFIYETGFSVPKDNGKAARWYETAAAKKNTLAQLRLGLMYLSGSGVKQSDIQAEKWLGAAADRGNGLAKGAVDMLLNAPPDMVLNKAEIAEQLRVISIKDEKKALAQLNATFQTAREKMERDKREREAQLAKRKGIQSASDQEAGIEFGLDAQGRRTIRWYQRNAERGVAMAQFRLGKYHEIGDEVPMDMKTAVRWYRSAAEQGYPEAQYYLGMLHYYGIGVERDEVLGQSLVKAAAGQGYEEARRALERAKSGETPEQRSMAVWWLTRVGQEADGLALRDAGTLFEQGRGVRADVNEARRLYQASTSAGGITTRRVTSSENVEMNQVPSARSDAERNQESDSGPPKRQQEITSNTGRSSGAPGNSMRRYVLMAIVAVLPIVAFGWFVAKEKKRLGERAKQKAKAAAKAKSPQASSGSTRREPANPFK